MNISVIGLGKLGLPWAAILAAKGHEVIGADRNAAVVDAVNAGRAPLPEPRLQDYVDQGRARLTATTDIAAAVAATDAAFIVVPTPSDPDGAFSNRFVLDGAAAIAAALSRTHGYHLVVLTSTVMPGSTAGQLIPALEQGSGKRCGPDFGVCYNPEFIAIGNVIHGMLRPDLVLIGESDPQAGQRREDP